MNEVSKYKLCKWLGTTLAVMFILPFAIAKLASECAGMALCMILFLVVNPLFSIILGIVSGRNLKKMWNLPIVSAVAFLAGAWIFFDIHELWFIAYAAIYLFLGIVTMIITYFLTKNES